MRQQQTGPRPKATLATSLLGAATMQELLVDGKGAGKALLAIAMCFLAIPSAQSQEAVVERDARLRTAVGLAAQRTLETSPEVPPGLRLLGVDVSSESVILDFSEELFSNGLGAELDQTLEAVMATAGNELVDELSEVHYEIRVEGVLLDQILSAAEPPAPL